jgi:hypothetical protein
MLIRDGVSLFLERLPVRARFRFQLDLS